jgi:TolB-like protein/DNA-binding winged helix-turn-helix (wHTH) protein
VPQSTSHRFRFGSFELDARSGELLRDGITVRLQEQPLRALLLLIEHPGALVTREQLRQGVWGDEAPPDIDPALNAIVKRLRDVLHDPADNPVFIQTVARRGYRFLAPVEARAAVPRDDGITADVPSLDEAAPTASSDGAPPASSGAPPPAPSRRRIDRRFAAAAIAVAIAAGTMVVRQLTARRGEPHPSRQARLAVLPFDNLAGDDEQFFADGLHEEMILRLGRMQPRRLAVIARTSVLPYRGAAKTIATIARELGVDYVLEGSVRHAGEHFRITAQLIRADNQLHLWTETYDRSWQDILAIQADVGARVADSLAVELVPAYEAADAARDRSVNPQAYEHYLRGLFYWNQRARDPASQLARAIEQFKLAVGDQPDFAAAYAGLADAYDSLFFSNPAFGMEAHTNARTAIQRALQLDDRLASAYSALAWMTIHFDHDLPLAERHFRRALELDPNDPIARMRLSLVLAARGRLTEAVSEAETARRYDPLSAQITELQGWYAYYGGAPDDALQRIREAAEFAGEPMKVHVFAAYLAALRGDCRTATNEIGTPPFAADMLRLAEVAFVSARCAPAAAADTLLRDLEVRRLAYPAALFHFGRGDLDSFYDWLNRAIDERFPEPLYIGIDPVFARERSSPRFKAALRRLGV